jgi:type I restriction enzyme S subunit
MDETQLLKDYAFQALRHFGLKDIISGSAQPQIIAQDVRKYSLSTPPLPEQRKIADILSTWDEALETLDALIVAKTRQKQALMQQLLTGKTRVKGAKGKWKKVRFSEWLTESRIPGTDGSSAKKITVKLYGRGVYPKQDRLIGSENTKYYVRKSGQFIYSKLDFLNGAFGIVPESLDGYESTLDLPSFDVSPNADAKWLLYYVVRPEFYTQQLGAAAGGRKARRVNPSEFLAMKVLAPDLAEQQQIAAILDTADQELTLLRTQRQTLDQQKRGLMQRLLTGKVRVVV